MHMGRYSFWARVDSFCDLNRGPCSSVRCRVDIWNSNREVVVGPVSNCARCPFQIRYPEGERKTICCYYIGLFVPC